MYLDLPLIFGLYQDEINRKAEKTYPVSDTNLFPETMTSFGIYRVSCKSVIGSQAFVIFIYGFSSKRG